MWRECSVLRLAYICRTSLFGYRTGYGCSRCPGDIEVRVPILRSGGS